MSITASFTAVEQALWDHVHDKVMHGSGADIALFFPPDDLWRRFNLHLEGGLKSWSAWHSHFVTLAEPLAWAFSGDLSPFGGLRPLTAEREFPGDHYLAYVHRDHVEAVLQALKRQRLPSDARHDAHRASLHEELDRTIAAYAAAEARAKALFIQIA